MTAVTPREVARYLDILTVPLPTWEQVIDAAGAAYWRRRNIPASSRRRSMVIRDTCGSYDGFLAHFRLTEQPCPPCLKVRSQINAIRRLRKRLQ